VPFKGGAVGLEEVSQHIVSGGNRPAGARERWPRAGGSSGVPRGRVPTRTGGGGG
jgi:hypothetical protein